MALTITKTLDTAYGHIYAVYGTVKFGAGDTYSTGGNTLNLLQIGIKATRKPLNVIFDGNSGFVFDYAPGTTAADGKIKVLSGAAAQSALTELTAGAVPAGVSNDTIFFKAEFRGML